jgi:hypothetical protein
MPRKRTIRVSVCARCSTEFVRAHFRVRDDPKYCSTACKFGTVSQRLWESVTKTDTCWIRDGASTSGGYTGLRYKGRTVTAHRVAWEEATGETLSSSDFICHTCDVRQCMRNDDEGTYTVDGVHYPRRGHLFKAPGHMANTRDMIAKGRKRVATGASNGRRTRPESTPRGAGHANSKLTDEAVVEIRARYAAGGINQHQLAAEYGVTFSNISYVVRGVTWKHLL